MQYELNRGKEASLARLADDPHHRLVEDTVKEFGRWSCFEKKKPRSETDSSDDPEDADSPWEPPGSGMDRNIAADFKATSSRFGVGVIAEPYKRPLPKVGRNDRCPCGSGKKYKKCCLQ